MTQIPQELAERMAEVIPKLLAAYDLETCTHENTVRGGSIWTFCEDCERKWADDRGGFTPYEDPSEIAEARSIVAELPAPTDPDLIEARQYAVRLAVPLSARLITDHEHRRREKILRGELDDDPVVVHYLAGLKRGRALEREERK